MGHMWEGTNIQKLLGEFMSSWFTSQVDISQLETAETEEEGETHMVAEINIIKGKTLCSYNRTVMETIRIISHLGISSFPVNMVQLAL